MKIIYFGSTEDSIYTLDILKNNNFEIFAIFTKKSKSSGRGLKTNLTSVEKYGIKNKINIKKPNTLKNNNEIINYLSEANADIFIVSSYGIIIPKEILEIPKYGVINIHPSLLPKFRGPSPVASAILEAEKFTGVTIIKLDENMDTGPILEKSHKVSIGENDSASVLQEKLFKMGSDMLPGILRNIEQGNQRFISQNNNKASITKKINKIDGKINWNENDIEIIRKVRAYDKWPGTFTFWNNKRIKIIDVIKTQIDSIEKPGLVQFIDKKIYVSTKNRLLEIKKIQFENKNVMSADKAINGYSDLNGSSLD